MSARNKYLLIGLLVFVLIIVGAIFAFNFFKNKDEDKPIEYTPTGNISQTIDNPDVTTNSNVEESEEPTVDNTDLSDTLKPTDQMQQVIDQNKNDLNNTQVIDEITPSYPSNVIPVYKAKTAADSSDIITDNGKPGWIVNYGSDATIPEIREFYDSLLKSTNGYSNVQSGDTYTVTGQVDNCYVQIGISPNNPEQTGLNDLSDVSIFIERL